MLIVLQVLCFGSAAQCRGVKVELSEDLKSSENYVGQTQPIYSKR